MQAQDHLPGRLALVAAGIWQFVSWGGRISLLTDAEAVDQWNWFRIGGSLAVGADAVNSARGFMFALGCIQALQCNRNTCPTGITTHDEKLQRGLHPPSKAERVAQYAKNLTKEVGIIAHACGVTSARGLNRSHARVIRENGLSIPLTTLYPELVPVPDRQSDVS